MANEQLAAKANQLGLSSIVDLLIEKFGPVLANILLDALTKVQQQAALPAANMAAINIKNILGQLLQQFGPTLLDQFANLLAARGDAVSKFLAAVLRSGGPELLSLIEELLQSPQSLTAIADAVNKV